MDISNSALVILAQIIPILLLASYLDKDVLDEISKSRKRTKYYWLLSIFLIIVGEAVAVLGIIDGAGVDGIRGLLVLFAVLLALFNLLNIAGWRVLGLDLISGMPATKAQKTKKSRHH